MILTQNVVDAQFGFGRGFGIRRGFGGFGRPFVGPGFGYRRGFYGVPYGGYGGFSPYGFYG